MGLLDKISANWDRQGGLDGLLGALYGDVKNVGEGLSKFSDDLKYRMTGPGAYGSGLLDVRNNDVVTDAAMATMGTGYGPAVGRMAMGAKVADPSTLRMNVFKGGIHDTAKLGGEYLKRRWNVPEDKVGLNLSTNRHNGKSAYLTGPFGELRVSDHMSNPNYVTSNAVIIKPSAKDMVSAIDELMGLRKASANKVNKILDDWEIPLNAVVDKLKAGWEADLMHVKRSGTKTAHQKRKAAFLSKHNITSDEFNRLLSPKPNYRRMAVYSKSAGKQWSYPYRQ